MSDYEPEDLERQPTNQKPKRKKPKPDKTFYKKQFRSFCDEDGIPLHSSYVSWQEIGD